MPSRFGSDWNDGQDGQLLVAEREARHRRGDRQEQRVSKTVGVPCDQKCRRRRPLFSVAWPILGTPVAWTRRS